MKKKIALILSAVVLFAGLAFAQDATDEATSRDLAALRQKIRAMKREMDLLMGEIVSSAKTATAGGIGAANYSSFGSDVYVDIIQTDKSVLVKADLPGMAKDKISVVLDNEKFLKISGSREVIKNENAPGVVRQERFSGNFSKTIELPCEVTPVGINATYKDGVLEVVIPKKVGTQKEEMVKIPIK